MKMHKVTIIKGCAKIVGEHEIAIQSDEKVENIEAKNILNRHGFSASYASNKKVLNWL